MVGQLRSAPILADVVTLLLAVNTVVHCADQARYAFDPSEAGPETVVLLLAMAVDLCRCRLVWRW